MAKKLKLVTEANRGQTYQEIKGHVFFWEIEHRTKFFVYRVAEAMKTREDFRSRVAKCKKLCALPWDSDDHNGFLQKMIKHRTDKHKKAYDGSSI
uniref:Uncharacterized protein n=1 Tax=Arundo donax TaxID=35708 RepID=A0A0A9DVU9_ARUDO